MLVKCSRILKSELNEWYTRFQAERITWTPNKDWEMNSPTTDEVGPPPTNYCSTWNPLFLVKALFAFRCLCVNADIHHWLGMGGRTSWGESGIRKSVPHLLRKVWVSGTFPFPWCKDSHYGWLEVTNNKMAVGKARVIHILEPEGVLSSCCWVN